MSGRATFTDAATLQVPCPICNAKVGERCRSGGKRGRELTTSHAARERALRAQRRKLLELRRAAQGSLFDGGTS